MVETVAQAARTLDEIIALLCDVETATLGHILTEGFLPPAIQGLQEERRICGRALTVSMPPDDGAILAHALSHAARGDILIVDRQGDDRHACWGAVMTAAAQAAGIAGVVIDGFVTDVAAIRASGLPVWCRGRSPLTTKLLGRGGAIGGEIVCAGVTVHRGDLVLADENGVCVIDPLDAGRLADAALAMQAAEPGIIARVLAGERLDEINGSRALVERMGTNA